MEKSFFHGTFISLLKILMKKQKAKNFQIILQKENKVRHFYLRDTRLIIQTVCINTGKNK